MDRLTESAGTENEPAALYSPTEEVFNRWRQTLGLVLAPVVLVGMLMVPLGSLPVPAHRLAAILATVVLLWVCEALPVAVTALLGPTLAVILRVMPVKEAFAPFADPIIFLFIGSFILAKAMYVHGLDRRIAFTALSSRLVGASAGRVLVVYGAVTTVLSMWISNTATAAMMLPIGVSVVSQLSRDSRTSPAALRQFALIMMLMTAFGASLGGMATPIGTPPNLIGIGMLRNLAGAKISFFQWMLLGVPLSLLLYAALAVWFWAIGARHVELSAGSVRDVRNELQRLGPLSTGQRNVLIAFSLTVALWVLPGVLAVTSWDGSAFAKAYSAAVPESVAALVGGLLLFVMPIDWQSRQFTMTWDRAVKIDWGTILLFGGGMAMGSMAFSTGLAGAMGNAITDWFPSHTPLAYTALFTGFAILLSETTSNTAAASMVVPIAIAASLAAGIRPIEPALGATLGASVGFMLPISTPPNAIVYSSGLVPITSMIKYGFLLDVIGFVVVVAVVSILGPLVF